MSARVFESFTVYTGIWINWSYGKIRGSTLTLDQRTANLLIAFTALFVTLVSVHVWNITCFVIHAFYSNPRQHDIVHHQRQAILRNYRDPGTVVLTLVRVAWTWRRIHKIQKHLFLLVFTVMLSVGLTIATGFSSRIARDDHEVLLRGHQCGQFTKAITDDSVARAAAQADRVNIALNYASQCYEMSNTLSDCGGLINTRLKTNKTRHTACPFGNLCKSNTTTIALDTGYIDSHKDLGINTPNSQRFTVQIVWQCSVLETRGHTSMMNISNTQSFIMYNYSLGSDGQVQPTHMALNNAHDDYLKTLLPETGVPRPLAAQPDYSLGAEIAAFRNGSFRIGGYGFRPIDELGSQVADTHLVFLGTNAIVFDGKILDPWYHATKPAWEETIGPGTPPKLMYAADEPAPPLACLVQYRVCTPNMPEEKSCSAPMGIFGYPDEARKVLTYHVKHDTINWLEDYLRAFPSPRDIAFSSNSLKSRSRLRGGTQAALPVDQWEKDVEHWFNIASAYLQYYPVLTAAGYLSNVTEEGIQRPNSTRDLEICQNQKIKSTAFVSFSILWMSLVFAIGLLLTVLSLSLESICRLIQGRAGSLRYPLAEWNTNSCLQLQRLALEELGIGQWKGCDESIPFTKERTDVVPLDLSEPKHPRRSRPPHLSNKTSETEGCESIHALQAVSTGETHSLSGGLLGQFEWENQNAPQGTGQEG